MMMMSLAQLAMPLALAVTVQAVPARSASGLWHEIGIVDGHYMDGPAHAQAPYIRDMLDKNVIGRGGEFLGRVVGVRAAANVVEVQLPSGERALLDGGRLVDGADAVHAPDMSDSDMRRLAQLQTGRSVASQ
jgi:hypothetical protein